MKSGGDKSKSPLLLRIARDSDLDWMIWRPVLDKVVTLHEIKTTYSICELFDLHEALDIKAALEEESAKKSQTK